MKIKNIVIVIVMVIVGGLVSPASADSGHIIISEIQTYGQTATDEFVRLYNPTGATADISGWKLAKKTSSGSESNLVSSFAAGTAIPAGGYFLITHKTDYKGNETANAAYSGASYSVADNNTVILKNADGAIIDKVGFGAAADFEGAPSANPEQGKSIKRQNNQDTDNNKTDFAAAVEPPTQENPLQPSFSKGGSESPTENTPNQSSEYSATAKYSENASSASQNEIAFSSSTISAATATDIVSQNSPPHAAPKADIKKLSITEILPNPAGADTDKEYIKIFYNGDTDADLAGLYLDDEDGGSNPYKIPAGTIIKAEGELIFYREKTGLALNNDADAARILDFFKKEIVAVEFEDAKEGAAYVLQNGKWKWFDSVIASDSEAIPSHSVIPAKAGIQAKNSITATIIATPGIFSSQTMYVDGLQLYMYSRDWPELSVGDKISAWGEPSTYFGEPRLKLKNKSAIKIISQGNIAEPMETDGLSEDDLGRLIIMEGGVMETGANKIVLDANGEEIPIYDKTKKKLFANLKEKDSLRITGIVSRYKDDLRLLPRSAEDIKIIKPAVSAPLEKNNPLWQYAISTLTLGGIIAGIYVRRWKNGRQSQMG